MSNDTFDDFKSKVSITKHKIFVNNILYLQLLKFPYISTFIVIFSTPKYSKFKYSLQT